MENIPLSTKKRRTPEEAAALLAEQQRQGISDEQFATTQGITLSTLVRWRRRQQKSQTPRWIEVDQAPCVAPGTSMAQLRLADGLVIELCAGFEVDRMAQLIERLRQA